MELILKSNDETSIAKVIELAESLRMDIEIKELKIEANSEREAAKARILNFKSTTPSSFGDASKWQEE